MKSPSLWTSNSLNSSVARPGLRQEYLSERRRSNGPVKQRAEISCKYQRLGETVLMQPTHCGFASAFFAQSRPDEILPTFWLLFAPQSREKRCLYIHLLVARKRRTA